MQTLHKAPPRLSRTRTSSLTDLELLEQIIRLADPTNCRQIAEVLLAKRGSIADVLGASAGHLEGVDNTVATLLQTVHEVSIRAIRKTIDERPVLRSWDRVIDFLRLRLAHERVERLYLLYLDSGNTLIADEEQHHGTINHTPVYPREIMRRALELDAAALILCHNHPHGAPTPSRDAVLITRDVIAAAATFDIAVHDHIVISRHGHASLRTLGLMD